MFREILLHPTERDVRPRMENTRLLDEVTHLQHKVIFLLSNSSHSTVTESHTQSHPEASQALLEDFYMNNFLS